MTRCLYIKDFNVKDPVLFNWTYFYDTLVKKNGGRRQLQSIPTYCRGIDDQQEFEYYLNCAYYLRTSLNSFSLSSTIDYYGYLKEFKNLTELKIKKVKNIKTMFDCDRVLKYFPHLKIFSLDLFNTGGAAQESVSLKMLITIKILL